MPRSCDLLDQSAESLTGRNYQRVLPLLRFAEAFRSQDWGETVLDHPAARSFRERGASAPCFPERGTASAVSAGAETADSRPLLAVYKSIDQFLYGL